MMNITACVDLEAAGVPFQKKPDEGRMKGLAYCLSPEGYWIEIIRRSEHAEARAAGLKVNNPYHARIDFTLINPLFIQYIFHPNHSPTHSIIHILLFSCSFPLSSIRLLKQCFEQKIPRRVCIFIVICWV